MAVPQILASPDDQTSLTISTFTFEGRDFEGGMGT